jgi:hypothetical protein
MISIPSFYPEEKLSLGYGCLLFLLLIPSFRSHFVGFYLGVSIIVLVLLILLTAKRTGLWRSLRHLSLYLFLFLIYESIGQIVVALQRPVFDSQLLEIDRVLFGESPAMFFSINPWLSEIMSAGYLSYHLYIHGTILYFLLRPTENSYLFFRYLYCGFAIGLIGYLLIPAKGPFAAYQHLFDEPVSGFFITQFNSFMVSLGSPSYDVFPSLHVLMILIMLDFDWKNRRRIFWAMLPICMVLFTSTLYLRYHYAVDLIAGFLVFLGLRWWFWRFLKK